MASGAPLEYDQLQGIEWERQAVDAAGDDEGPFRTRGATGKNPTDRAKMGTKGIAC